MKMRSLPWALLVAAALSPGAPQAAEPPSGGKALAPDPFAAPAAEAKPQRPAATFEELLKDAVPVSDLATLVEPLYARCEDKDDLPRRQCEGIRAYLLERLKNRTFVALSDATLETSPYDASAKEIEMEIPGCISCVRPPIVAGEPRYLAARPPQRVVAGKAVGVPLTTHQLPMETKVRADRFLERVVPRLQVQHIFRIGQPFGDAAQAGAPPRLKGVQIIPVAHRVYDRCTGQVTASSHASALVKLKPDKSCPKKGAEELSQAEIAQEAQRATLPERLSSKQVETALQPVQEKIHDCYMEFEQLGGTAKVQLTLTGEGKFTQVTLSPPYDKAPIGICIKSQIKTAVFPKFRGDSMRIDYAFQVN